jgi:ADP-ribose pyrophosphatase YjhB (NUDIX family)
MKRSSQPSEWIPEHVWRQVKRCIPIPCVDVLLENSDGEMLLGWRKISPYVNVWATPGGRMFRGESLRNATHRILGEYGLRAHNLFLVGVFPVKFPTRADFTICVASNRPAGIAVADGHEFSSFKWTRKVPSKTGANYVKMMLRWRLLRRNVQALRFTRIY